jgi:hypothetical protein
MTSLDFYTILAPELAVGRISGFRILGRSRVGHSGDSSLLPLATPINQHEYSEEIHGKKPCVDISEEVFKEIIVRVDIGEGELSNAILQRLQPCDLIYAGNR